MPFDEIVIIFKDHLPDAERTRVSNNTLREDLFDLSLTDDEFGILMHDFPNELKRISRNKYFYDLHHIQTTTFEDGFSSFSISFGRGKDYHYIITGSFVRDAGPSKSLVWIKSTKGG